MSINFTGKVPTSKEFINNLLEDESLKIQSVTLSLLKREENKFNLVVEFEDIK